MKTDALAAQALADSTLYDAGFADGLASAALPPAPGISAEQEAADIAAAVSPLNAQITALQLAKTTEDELLASVQDAAKKLAALFG